MATNKKITALTELSSVQWADDDVVPIVDVSEQATKKIQLSVFRNAVGGALAPVLLGGNTTGGTDIVVSSGDAITTNTISETTAASGVTIDSLLVKDGGITAAGTSTFAGQTITDLGTVTTADINGGTIDGTTIGGSSAAAATFTTANATTVDSTNIEVTNIKAKDGTAAGSIADSTGVVTINSAVLTTADINGGTIDGTSIGATSQSTGGFSSLTIGSATAVTDVDTDLTTVSASDDTLASAKAIKTYVDSQVGTSDTLSEILANGNTTGANNIIVTAGQSVTVDTISETTAASGVTVDSLLIKDGGITAAGTSTFAGQTISNLGSVTTADINGGTIDGTTIGGSSAAAGTFTTFTSTGIDDNASSTAITIDSSQNIGIGTATPGTYRLNVQDSTDSVGTAYFDNSGLNTWGIEIGAFTASSGSDLVLTSNSVIGSQNSLTFAAETGGYWRWMTGATSHKTGTAGASEVMRITSDGYVGIGNSAPAGLLEIGDAQVAGSNNEDGFSFETSGQIRHSTNSSVAMYMTDTSSAAGTHNYIGFRYQGTTIGDIDTLDNSTIRYNTFTGAHWSQFTDHSQPEIPLGTVMSTINEMCNHTQFEYVDEKGETQKTDIAGSFEIGSTHTIYIDEDGAQAEGTAISQSTHKRLAKVKVSDTAGDKSVYGVFAGHYKDGDSSIESLGLGAIRVGSGVTVANGDLLESAGDGTARPQTGDNADLFKASTIAKVTSTTVIETYDDGSYTVPCTLHCG